MGETNQEKRSYCPAIRSYSLGVQIEASEIRFIETFVGTILDDSQLPSCPWVLG